MGTLLTLLVTSVVFALAAMRWGYESSDTGSYEWERREQSAWQGGMAGNPVPGGRQKPWPITARSAGKCAGSACI